MGSKVLQIQQLLAQDDPAAFISETWNRFNNQRQGKVKDWLELRNYIFATDTKSTSNRVLPWKNSTTTPKLCQIRDNLHSNYISALFPNDRWLQWEAHTKDSAKHAVAKTIEGYMENKCREGHFRTEISKMVYDYIDYGNAFSTVTYESGYKEEKDGTKTPLYIGPRIHRISPLDIVFDPTAESIQKTFKIVRSIKTIGEIERLVRDEPEQAFWAEALSKRRELISNLGGYSYEDFQKSVGYSIDGFGNLYEYLMSNYVEVLEFYGDYSDGEGNLETDRIITITDRKNVVRNEQIPTWFGGAPINHVGWRFRQDNLWAMGPLDNLVGMQYRIDHLENAKADAFDLTIHPPVKVIGTVEEFDWEPGAEIYCAEGGDVAPVQNNLNSIITADNMIASLEGKMELYAGAPRDAMGIRTPGEKTAFEVNQLMTAAGRIFQEKATQFEVEMLEPSLNMMLESARRNMDGIDVIRVIDDDLNVKQFMDIRKEDITASGIIRPIGARHFSKQQQDLQNLIGIFNSPIGQMIAPHTSALALTDLVNDIVGVTAYELFRANVAVDEKKSTQAAINQSQEDLAVQQQVQMPQGA